MHTLLDKKKRGILKKLVSSFLSGAKGLYRRYRKSYEKQKKINEEAIKNLRKNKAFGFDRSLDADMIAKEIRRLRRFYGGKTKLEKGPTTIK